MNIFLSYPSEDRAIAQATELALRAQGHQVFFDRDSLPPGEAYDARIRQAIERADLMVVLLSPQTVDAGSYTLTEIEIASKTWKNPSGRLLPVLLRPTPLESIPAYVRSVTLLQPEGNVPASIADAAYRIARARRSRLRKIGVPAAIAIIAIAAWLVTTDRGRSHEYVGPDGAKALFIAAGAFTMGDDEASPRREVYVDAFYLDQHEVTTARYARFLVATGSVQPPDGWDDPDRARGADLPVIGVDWNDAAAYCKWAGKRLPTETEWEKAARGADARRYPWGSEPPTATLANFQNFAPRPYARGLDPVGAHAAGRSAAGIDDLAGNAAEWVADWYSEAFARGDVRNPKGPPTGQGRVIRGGGWRDSAERITATARAYANPSTRAEDIGFRCARDAG